MPSRDDHYVILYAILLVSLSVVEHFERECGGKR
jgi:hypothetical protein